MCDFKPGDEVVCIIATDMPWDLDTDRDSVFGLIEGRQYTVRDVGPSPYEDETGIFVFLVETENTDEDGTDGGYYPLRFRPLTRTQSTLAIESFLTIKPGFEEPRRKVVEPVKEGV